MILVDVVTIRHIFKNMRHPADKWVLSIAVIFFPFAVCPIYWLVRLFSKLSCIITHPPGKSRKNAISANRTDKEAEALTLGSLSLRVGIALLILPVAVSLLFALVILFAPRIPAEPKWPSLSVHQVMSISLEPWLGYSGQTISEQIVLTNTADFQRWHTAVDRATPLEHWRGTAINRDLGPRKLIMRFSTTNKTNVVFEVWMCDRNQAAACKEDLVTTQYVATNYSRELRSLITKAIDQHPNIRWISAHKKHWDAESVRYIGK
jgi:hypothetical protein